MISRNEAEAARSPSRGGRRICRQATVWDRPSASHGLVSNPSPAAHLLCNPRQVIDVSEPQGSHLWGG